MKTLFTYKEFDDNLVSVIIPVLNELENVKIINRMLKIAFASSDFNYEIIYVDDHSTDGTYEYLLKQQDKWLSADSKGPTQKQSVSVYKKRGRPGKAFSLIEGFSYARGGILAMVDADLQYPVTEIPDMVKRLKTSDIIVGYRKVIKTSFSRKIASRVFKTVFGRVLFNIDSDIQSGLKVFKRQVYESVKFTPQSAWTFDLEFLYRALEAGFKIGNYNITFAKRQNGSSKLNFVKQIIELSTNAFLLKFRKLNPVLILPESKRSMLGAGIGFRRKQFITHTTLPYTHSAFRTIMSPQFLFLALCIMLLGYGIFANTLLTLQLFVGIISLIYFIDVVFNFYVNWRSLTKKWEIDFTQDELGAIDERTLPVYSILCPLYKEGAVLPQFIEAIDKLDWPKEKLDVLLLLEQDDKETIRLAKKMNLPSHVRIVEVPFSQPKTKPKACNYGLNIAKGELIVIYDAEDIPDSDQLKKAYLGFLKSDNNIACLQAKLSYYNPKQNLLTRFFMAEYSLWFNLTLPGLQSLNTSLPLGGTSNHFKTEVLKQLKGWDTFNVTEDADLGIRLFKNGYRTAIIESVTNEEANSDLHNWLRQRSRWIKGYLQSYLVHTRDLLKYAKNNKTHAILMQLILGTKLSFIFLNPLLWVVTLSYFLLYSRVGPYIEAVYRTPAFYLAILSLIFGNFIFFYYYLIGNAKKNQWDMMRSSLFIPLYWIFISIAGWIALYQLIFKPHYWEKTIHGLHLKKKKEKSKEIEVVIEIEDEVVKQPEVVVSPVTSKKRFSLPRLSFGGLVSSGFVLIVCTVIAHVLNLLFNVYVFRQPSVSLTTVNLIGITTSLLYFISIPLSAVEATSIYKTGILSSENNLNSAMSYWSRTRKTLLIFTLILVVSWLIANPALKTYFNLNSGFPLLLFTPVLAVAFIYVHDRGLLSGLMHFEKLAMLALVEPVVKLMIAVSLIYVGFSELAFAAIPYAFVASFIACGMFLPKRSIVKENKASANLKFPKRFFFASLLTGFSGAAYLSLDMILAGNLLTSNDVGIYALIAFVGKIIFFLGTLSTQFILPLSSRFKNNKKYSERILSITLLLTVIFAFSGLLIFGVFADKSLPFLLGDKAGLVLPHIMLFAIGITAFTISRVFVTYYLSKNVFSFPVAATIVTLTQLLVVNKANITLDQFVYYMALIGVGNLLIAVILHANIFLVTYFENAIKALLTSLDKTDADGNTERAPSVLILNWRDIKHAWAGGAEVYIHEIAKRWAAQGINVTVFSGFDGKTKLNETIEGVNVIRRGGKYTVYLWAFLYYMFFFRKNSDVIIDCENGIPFFTPLYSGKPVFLLIHHVHKKVFSQYLPKPFANLAAMLETNIMPRVYKNIPVITVSESSKQEILKLGHFKAENISIIYNGIDNTLFTPGVKTASPSFIYLGRLKPHKNIDIGIKAFSEILKRYPQAKLNIVGDGEEEVRLKNLANSLNLNGSVRFTGRVTDKVKAEMLRESWVMIQPSSAEGWGITVTEANCSGTPVIASNVAGLKDSVINNETGILIEEQNIKQMTLAMDYLLSNQSQLIKYSRNSYAWSKNFSWDKSAEIWYLLIEDTLLYKLKNVRAAVAERNA